MNQLAPFQSPAIEQPFNVKKAVTISLITGATACAIYYGIRKLVNDNKANTSDAKSFQQGTPATMATKINMALTKGTFGANTAELRQSLTEIKSKDEMKKMMLEYSNQYHKQLNADLKDNLKPSEYDEMLAIVEAKPEKTGQVPKDTQYKAWARRIKAAFDKKVLGFDALDIDALTAALRDVPTQIAFINVAKAYYDLFKDNVLTAMKKKLHFWEYDDYMKIITDKPKGK